MSKNIFRYAEKLMKRYPEFSLIMTSAEDVIVEKEIISEIGSKTILELGTATGAWASWIHKNVDNCNFYLTENFKELPKYSSYTKFPKNIAELSNNLIDFTDNTINCKIFSADFFEIKHKIHEPIDYARIDCNTKNMKQVFEYLLETGSHELIIVLDDCTPNSAICRLLVLSEFIHTKQLKVFWAGKERMAFCRYDYNSKPVIDYLTYKNKTIKKYFDTVYTWKDFAIADTPQYYLVTKAGK